MKKNAEKMGKIICILFFAALSNRCNAQFCIGNFSTFTTAASCNMYNGTATVTANFGTGPYLYSMDSAMTFQIYDTFNNLATGLYNFAVKNGPDGCIVHQFVYVPNDPRNTWMGTANNEWENPANWSCGNVPDSGAHVIINSGTVVINSNVTITELVLNSNAVLTVNDGFNLLILH